MTEITVRLFATLKDLAGSQHVSVTLTNVGALTIDDIREALCEQVPALAPAMPSAIAAVNREYVFSGHGIDPDDEIAFFPPVSGGDGFPEYFALNEGPVDLNALTARIVTPATGAVALFSGFVRGETHNNAGVIETARLEYEAYEPMALAKMQQVAQEIRQQWPLVQGIAIVQSIGMLEVGQPTVLIACAAGHRDQGCFEAARYGIDRLKEIVPVWKKEVRTDGQSWVEGSYMPGPQDRHDTPSN
jgi:molybdopterin synthase catalytic subunit